MHIIPRKKLKIKINHNDVFSMSASDVRNLRVRLGEHNIKQAGETTIWESAVARVVRHKEFSQQTLVGSKAR